LRHRVEALCYMRSSLRDEECTLVLSELSEPSWNALRTYVRMRTVVFAPEGRPRLAQGFNPESYLGAQVPRFDTPKGLYYRAQGQREARHPGMRSP